ncbi:cyclin-dependent kinase 2-associated protein 2-like [Phoca vitulina]|uniref:cyclin-dependent kinase 2-associated protein 2-like n=1 Tax=Phoca vitulina TaxID=9720 RepID=UPI001395E670|nr:cyclin-dependent kinase 2-associated protein 2-like [Phoca vitulina]
MSYKPIAPAPNSTPGSSTPGPSTPVPTAGSVPSPSGLVPGATAPFRPLFNDFGPPSMGYVQAMKPPGAQGSQTTYTDLLSVIEEMGKEIQPTYAGSKSTIKSLKRGIIHAQALVRECLAETEWNARHVTGRNSATESGPFLATAEHLFLPGLHPELHFPTWASCPVSLGGCPPGTRGALTSVNSTDWDSFKS